MTTLWRASLLAATLLGGILAPQPRVPWAEAAGGPAFAGEDGGAAGITTPERAVETARGHPEVRERLQGRDDVRAKAEWHEGFEVWIVRIRSGDRLLAFATVSRDGKVLEVGPDRNEEREGAPGGSLPEPPFVVNCGSREVEGETGFPARQGGLAVLPDRRFGAGPYGHEGGEEFRVWNAAIWGRPERELPLYRTGRIEPLAYRFSLPPGRYLVACGFCESRVQAPGQRVFDVLAQGEVALEAVDPFALAGHSQAVRLSFTASVLGEEGLTIAFRCRRGEAFVNAIWVWSCPAEAPEPPRAPAAHGFGGYGLAALFWESAADPDVAGCRVERMGPRDSTFQPRTDAPIPAARWIDFDVKAGETYRYRLRAVSRAGDVGPPGEALALAPRSPADSPLPWYALEVPEASLAHMLAATAEERIVGARFAHDGREHPADLRIHGASTRRAAKLSYFVEFRGEGPFEARDAMYLKSQPFDFTLQQEKLSADIHAALGVPVSDARYVNLAINGRHQGVYLEMEPIRRPFKARAGLDPGGYLLRGDSFQHVGQGKVFAERRPGRGRKERERFDLAELFRQLSRIEPGAFEALVRGATDWPEVRDYLVAAVLCHRTEIEADDAYYYRDPRTGRWSIVPWDNNNGNFGIAGASTRLEAPRLSPYGTLTFQTVAGRHPFWYVLPSRAFQDRNLREDYFGRLEAAAREWLVGGKIDALIDANDRRLREAWTLDPYRWPPGADDPFLGAPPCLKDFARRHGRRVLEEIEGERRSKPPPVAIGEFSLAGEDGWVELENRSDGALSLAGWSLDPLVGRERPRYILGDGIRLGPGERLVLSIRELALWRPPAEGPEGPASEAEIEERRRLGLLRDPGPVFGRDGGVLGLVAPRPRGGKDSDEADGPARVVDWLFYGWQTPGFSYGRLEDTFAHLRPTPGAPNCGPPLTPPPVLIDGGVVWEGRRPRAVRVFATDLIPACDPADLELTLHYRDRERWRETRMAIAPLGGDRKPARATAMARAELPSDLEADSLEYWVLARTPEGLERPAPLTAPRETYKDAWEDHGQ